MGELACDVFREKIRYLDAGHTCHRYGISQKLCNTRERDDGCQWPQTAIPLLRLALGCSIGRNIVRQAGYEGEAADWEEYALWLGQTYSLRFWGESASNSMVVLSEFLIFCSQERASLGDSEDEEREEETNESREERTAPQDERGETQVSGAGRVVETHDEMPDTAAEAHVDRGDANYAFGSPFEDQTEGSEGVEEVGQATLLSRSHGTEMGPQLDVERVRRLVDGWKDVCIICKVRGRSNDDHGHWKGCRSATVASDKAAIEATLEVLLRVKFESFSGCVYCRRPQAVCELWDRKETGGRVVFKKRAGVFCRYGAWLTEGASVLLALKTSDGLEQRRDREGQTWEKEFIREMGKKGRRGGGGVRVQRFVCIFLQVGLEGEVGIYYRTAVLGRNVSARLNERKRVRRRVFRPKRALHPSRRTRQALDRGLGNTVGFRK